MAAKKPLRHELAKMITVQELFATLKDVAIQAGYLTTIHHGGLEAERRYILSPWATAITSDAEVIRRFRDSTSARWGVPVDVKGPDTEVWYRHDYHVYVNAEHHLLVSVFTPPRQP